MTSDDLLGIQCMVGVINQEEDKCVSIATSDGQFLIKSPWGLCRERGSELGLSKQAWHSCVPLKWSFLTWRVSQNCLHIDDCLKSFGFQLASKL